MTNRRPGMRRACARRRNATKPGKRSVTEKRLALTKWARHLQAVIAEADGKSRPPPARYQRRQLGKYRCLELLEEDSDWLR